MSFLQNHGAKHSTAQSKVHDYTNRQPCEKSTRQKNRYNATEQLRKKASARWTVNNFGAMLESEKSKCPECTVIGVIGSKLLLMFLCIMSRSVNVSLSLPLILTKWTSNPRLYSLCNVMVLTVACLQAEARMLFFFGIKHETMVFTLILINVPRFTWCHFLVIVVSLAALNSPLVLRMSYKW